MKRFFNVKALCNYYDEVKKVEVLDYDRNKYCTVRFEDGTLDDVKKYSLYNLPKGFKFNLLPYDYEETITSKEIAKDLRNHNRYHFKLFNKFKTGITIKFFKSDDLKYNNIDYEFKGTRKEIIKHFNSLPKDKINNFSVHLNFYKKNGLTSGSCFSYKNKKTVVYCFRNKQQNKFIKQLLRSLFKIKVKD